MAVTRRNALLRLRNHYSYNILNFQIIWNVCVPTIIEGEESAYKLLYKASISFIGRGSPIR